MYVVEEKNRNKEKLTLIFPSFSLENEGGEEENITSLTS